LHADPTIVGYASEGSVNPRLPLKRLNNYESAGRSRTRALLSYNASRKKSVKLGSHANE
jgi:hypothetical protein